ncbi:MAG: hypothetical protein EBZ36_18965, partial [Acidobacteria bacterium]|nr:hypothetical protein [Acidobacteriota bacterium]
MIVIIRVLWHKKAIGFVVNPRHFLNLPQEVIRRVPVVLAISREMRRKSARPVFPWKVADQHFSRGWFVL